MGKAQGCTLHFRTPDPRSEKSKWPGGHKSNEEFKYIYFSFISIRYKINLSREADAKPQFASKVSSLDVSNGPRTHSP